MPPYTTLLRINISLVTNNKINYGSLLVFVVLLLLVVAIGYHLWLTGMDFAQRPSYLRKAVGGLLLAAAALCILGPVGLGYWELTQLLAWL